MTERGTERIVAAACLHNGEIWTLPAPHRHHHILRKIYDETGQVGSGGEAQGFVTDTGRYVNRWKAMRIAHRAGQISEIRKGRGLDELFSEDLW